MRDLFNSTNFIKFREIETILRSSDAVNKIIEKAINNQINGKYSLDDYLSNIDSYLYGIVQLPSNNIEEIKEWIKNYIHYLYIPLVNKEPLYIIKSRFINEIFKLENNSSKINEELQSFIESKIITYLKNTFDQKEEIIEKEIDEKLKDKNIIEYLKNYYNIYKNKKHIKKIYLNNEDLQRELEKTFEFL